MRFTLRDWLLVMVSVSLAIGWWIDHRVQTQRLADLRTQWLSSIPPPFPAPGVVERMLTEENARLRALLDKHQIPNAPEESLDEEPEK
jgi:ABC-type anion transport system duplicated permease subunit